VARPDRLCPVAPAERRLLARGLGRAYGDAAVPSSEATLVLETTRADRILGWDAATGRLHCEAGLTLAEILRLFLLNRLKTVHSLQLQEFLNLEGIFLFQNTLEI